MAVRMAPVFLVLFLVTFLFDTRIGLAFLLIAIVMLYRGNTARRLCQTRAETPRPPQAMWQDPWGTANKP